MEPPSYAVGARRSASTDVAAAVAGDRAASYRVLGGVAPSVARLVRRHAGGRAVEIEDLTQVALLALARSLPGYRGEGEFMHWVARVVRRAVVPLLRKQREERQVVQRQGAEEPAAPPVDLLALSHARALVSALPGAQREVVVMHHVLGMSVQEIARATGVPGETVRSRLRLARQRLRGRAR